MNAQRRLRAGLILLALAALVLVVFDVGGPVRSGLALVFVLVLPGLALSLSMGPMSVEARLLVTVAGSAALATVVSVLLVAAGVWSAPLAAAVLAAATVAAVLIAGRTSPTVPPDATACPPPDPVSIAPDEPARRSR